ncbi:putative reverse transcriptase domain, reverse transcriptase zinc-binding domain protein [Tanacetum coccineum]
MEHVQKRTGDRKNKWLSFAGRFKLCISVISSMHIYWASVFILPVGIINDIEQLMCGFLCCQGVMQHGKAKVAWRDGCFPKVEEGLGIRKLESFNIALMAFRIWKIFNDKDFLWVCWIHSYKLIDRSLWDVKVRGSVSWGWRKLLSIQDIIRPHIWFKIGDGNNASVWYFMWADYCPLINHVTSRAIVNACYKNSDRIADVVTSDTWTWPNEWIDRFSSLREIKMPQLTLNQHDTMVWKSNDGSFKQFFVREVWHSIRHSRNEVQWSYVVWSRYCILRHAIRTWLVMRHRLKTQDRLKQWDVRNDLDLASLRCHYKKKVF